MGKYFNKTKAPLVATGVDGVAYVFSPKRWVYVPNEAENSAHILAYRRKGLLVRQEEGSALIEGAFEATPSEAVIANSSTEFSFSVPQNRSNEEISLEEEVIAKEVYDEEQEILTMSLDKD